MKRLENHLKKTQESRKYYDSLRARLGRGLFWTASGLYVLFGGGGCSSEPPPPGTPQAQLTLTPQKGGKPLDVLLDASGSVPVEGYIRKYSFDFDGDGNPDYEENDVFSPDGTFDGQTTHQYIDEGDYAPAVTVENSVGKKDIAQELLGVGFGAEKAEAINYIDQYFVDNYQNTQKDVDFQVWDPVAGIMVAYTADIEGYDPATGKTTCVIYDSDNLTQQQKDTITARETEGLDEPAIVLIEPEDSPQIIESLVIP